MQMWRTLPDGLVVALSVAAGLVAALAGGRLLAGILERLLRRGRFPARPLSRVSRPFGLWLGTSVTAVLLGAADRPWLHHELRRSLVLPAVVLWLALILVDVAWDTYGRRRAGTHPQLSGLLLLVRRAGKVLVLVSAFGYALGRLGVPVGNLVVLGGVVGAAVAFAARGPVENLFAFVSLVVDPPFVIGDEIRFVHLRGGPEIRGRVQRVGLQSTVVQVKGRSLMSIPNGPLTHSMWIENLSARDRRRLRLSLAVPETLSSTALDKLCGGVQRELEELPLRDPERPPRVWISGTSGEPRLELQVWIKPLDRDLRRTAEQAAVLAVRKELDRQERPGLRAQIH